jgi:hypothetical protein
MAIADRPGFEMAIAEGPGFEAPASDSYGAVRREFARLLGPAEGS